MTEPLKPEPLNPRPVGITVTGAAGTVAYSLLFRLASGEVLGAETPIALRLLEIEPALGALEGVAMELTDGAYPLLADITTTSDPAVGFDGTSWALLLGSSPRKAGMERADLLERNAAIFREQGRAIGAHAASDVRTLVVGNPCNTNALIAAANAPDVPRERWFAMTRLDQNRATAQLAARAGVPVGAVSNVAIWGNHSATQYPDPFHARVSGRAAPEVVRDEAWLRGEFVTSVQNRGAAVIAARGHSSGASAAQAVVDCVRAIAGRTPADTWASFGVFSRGEYDVPEGLNFSYPLTFDPADADSSGTPWQVVQGLDHDPEARERLRITTEELLTERALVADQLPI